MYKIMIKYKSASNKTFWYEHQTILVDGNAIEFSTDNMAVLENELKLIGKKYGNENIRIVNDITYDVCVDVPEPTNIGDVTLTTSEDVNNIYNTAFNKVFGGGT